MKGASVWPGEKAKTINGDLVDTASSIIFCLTMLIHVLHISLARYFADPGYASRDLAALENVS
jgi:hypothetical protein